MLARYSCWHFASQLYPERERRLLAFASQGFSDPTKDPQNSAKPGENANSEHSPQDTENPQTPKLLPGSGVWMNLPDGSVVEIDPTASTKEKGKEEETKKKESSKNDKNEEKNIQETQQESRKDLAEKILGRKEALIGGLAEIHHSQNRIKHLSENRERLSKVFPDEKENFWRMEQFEREATTNLGLMETMLSVFNEWESGNMPPASYVEGLNSYFKKSGESKTLTLGSEFDIDTDKWITMDSSERAAKRQKVDEEIAKQIDIDETLSAVDSMQIHISSTLDEYEKTLRSLDTATANFAGADINPSNIYVRVWGGIEWVTINDLIQGLMKTWKGFEKAWERRGDNTSNYIAERFGNITRFLPMGKQVQAELAAGRETSNDTQKKEEIERLERTKAPFEQAVQELKGYAHTPNRFYGVVEFMAKKGWLYDYNLERGTIFGVEMPTPPGWTAANMNEYKVSLNVMDSGGQDQQKKDMIEIIGTHESIPPIVDSLRVELQKHNYWAAYAALDIAMQKGKIGNAGTWICTTVMDHFRNDPDGFKYMPKELFDQMGNIGIVHPAWTSTLFKVDRHDLDDWRKTGRKDRFYEAGHLARGIMLVEEDVINKCGPQTQEKLNKIVSEVLAGNIYKDPETGNKLSIFSNRYNGYRKIILDSKTSTSPAKADDDFFGNISDAHLISSDGVRAILTINSVGDFNENTRAQNYITNLLDLLNQLEANGLTEEAENMKRENRSKLNRYFDQDAGGTVPKITNWTKRKSYKGELLVPLFVRKGLLDLEIARPFLRPKELQLLEQEFNVSPVSRANPPSNPSAASGALAPTQAA